MKKILFLLVLLTIIFLIACSHPSQEYEYYDNMSENTWYPVSTGTLLFSDTSIDVCRMEHATAHIYDTWYQTIDSNFKISYVSNSIYITKNHLPDFRDGEKLNKFQLDRLYKK